MRHLLLLFLLCQICKARRNLSTNVNSGTNAGTYAASLCRNPVSYAGWTACESNSPFCTEKTGWTCCQRKLASCLQDCQSECGFSYKWITRPCQCLDGVYNYPITGYYYGVLFGNQQSAQQAQQNGAVQASTSTYIYQNRTHTRLLPDGQCGMRDNYDVTRFRILGGSPAMPSSWKWAVALVSHRDLSQVFCSGTLIGPSWVLTAAHCLHDSYGRHRSFKLVIADHDRTVRERHEIVRLPELTYTPPGYSLFSTTHDVALVKLNQPVARGPHVEFACLPDPEFILHVSHKCYATGWGRTHVLSDFPTELREVELPLVAWNECRLYYPQLTRRQLCAGAVGRQAARDTCIGDSGSGLVCKVAVHHNVESRMPLAQFDDADAEGPPAPPPSRPRGRKDRLYEPLRTMDEVRTSVHHQWFVYGVTSFGDGCGTKYGVYQRVSAFVDWIKQTTGL